MKIGTLVTHLFGEDTGTIGVVVGPSNDYWGRPDPDWFYVQWSNGLRTTQTIHHVEVLSESR